MVEQAFYLWTKYISKAFSIVFSSPEDWNPEIWEMVKTLNATMTLIGTAFLGLFFYIGIVKNCMDYRQLKEPGYWIKPLLKLAITNFVMTFSMEIMMGVFKICQGLMHKVSGVGTMSYTVDVPTAIKAAFDEVSFFQNVVIGVIGLLLLLFCTVLSVALLVVVWGRFLRLYLYNATAPIFISFGAGEATQSAAITFVKSWISVCLQGVIIVFALVIYTKLITNDNSEAVTLVESGAVYSGVLTFIADFTIGAIVTLGICKGADQIISKMTGY